MAYSLSPNIVAHEAGIELRLEKVGMKTRTVAVAGDYLAINPKGYIPALELNNGEILTEGRGDRSVSCGPQARIGACAFLGYDGALAARPAVTAAMKAQGLIN
jgi:hypothetical protein